MTKRAGIRHGYLELKAYLIAHLANRMFKRQMHRKVEADAIAKDK